MSGAQIYAQAKYCGDRCRKAASRERISRDKNCKKTQKGSVPLSAVTTPLQRIESSREIMTKKTVEGRPKTGSLDPRIVPDAKWPGMYRIRRPHGSLSDMPNLTRIQRCPARNGSPHAGSADTEGSMSQEMAPLAAREFRDRIVGLDRLLRP